MPPKKRSDTDPVTQARSELRHALQRWGTDHRRIVIGVSGGADSTALLRLLHELRPEFDLELIVGHFDHQLRPESATDADWVRDLCASLTIPCHLGSPRESMSPAFSEERARRQRYRFMIDLAREHGATCLVVAHTSDDQAETVLHHIIRGTSLDGLRGMPVRRKLGPTLHLIRPLLATPRSVLRDYLTEIGQAYRSDPTNDDSRWTRNSLRNEILPRLAERFNPQVVTALVQLANEARDCTRVLRRTARRLLKRSILDQSPDGVRCSITSFQQTDPTVVRHAAVTIWRSQHWPRQAMSAAHWRNAARLLRGEITGPIHFPQGVRGMLRGQLAAFIGPVSPPILPKPSEQPNTSVTITAH